MYSLDEDGIFDRILREEEQSGNNTDVLSNDAILIIMKTKRTNTHVVRNRCMDFSEDVHLEFS